MATYHMSVGKLITVSFTRDELNCTKMTQIPFKIDSTRYRLTAVVLVMGMEPMAMVVAWKDMPTVMVMV